MKLKQSEFSQKGTLSTRSSDTLVAESLSFKQNLMTERLVHGKIFQFCPFYVKQFLLATGGSSTVEDFEVLGYEQIRLHDS